MINRCQLIFLSFSTANNSDKKCTVEDMAEEPSQDMTDN